MPKYTWIGEGNGHPLQFSCLENPMDRGAWQATYSPWSPKESDMTEPTEQQPPHIAEWVLKNKPKPLTFLLQILKWCPVAFEITSSIYRPCRNQPLPGITLSSFPTLQSHWLAFCSVNIFLHQSRHWGSSVCLQNSSISHLANPKRFFLTETLSDSWCRSTLSVESSLSTRPVSEHK